MTSPARPGAKQISPEKVALYIRWSTDDQAEGTTLDVQMEGCRHYALSQGWTVNEDLIFIDDGYSGGTLDRPAMHRLRKAVQDGQVDCVVVFKLDRLSRSVVDTVNLVLQEWDDLCHVKSAREPIDTTNHAGKMFFYMLVSYAEWERNVIRERTWGGRLKRAQEGRNPGFNAPYGYKVGDQPGKLEIVPEEASIVQRIFQMYLHGYGHRSIFNTLNGEGLRFRDGRLWAGSTIGRILSSPVYVGDLVWGHRRITNPRFGKREGERTRYRSETPMAYRKDAFPAVVDRKDWDQVQIIRAGKPAPHRGGSGRAVSSNYLITGLARCTCGGAIIAREAESRHKYYICAAKNSKGNTQCDCGYINANQVDEVVVAELRRLYGSKMKRDKVLGVMKAETQQKLDSLLPALQEADKLLARLREQDRELRDQYRHKEISLQEYRAFKSDLDGDLLVANQRRDELAKVIGETNRNLQNHDQWEALLARVDEWESLTMPQRKHLLRTVCRRLVVYRKPRGSEVLFDATWVEP